jgi:hypothetical protein
MKCPPIVEQQSVARLKFLPDNPTRRGIEQVAHGFYPINSQDDKGLNPHNDSSSTTVIYNGMEIRVFGNVNGFAYLQLGNKSVNEYDSKIRYRMQIIAVEK